MDRLFDKVLVRVPGNSYRDCVSKNPIHETIDTKKAIEQHEIYVKTLESFGIEVIELSPEESYPDSVFVQDTALIGTETNTVVICRFGEASRRGEEKSVADYLKKEGFEIKEIEPPGTIEGGDILVTDKDIIFVGLSERTNEGGIDQLAYHFPEQKVVKVPVSEVFHLLSGVNFIGDGTLAVCPDLIDTTYFDDFNLIKISKDEQNSRYENKSINLLYLGDKNILMPDVYPNTEKILQEKGYTPVTIKVSEFWKGDAGVTCPMLPFYKDL
ncbi:MAG: dimethylarginine dimethylaminohydrolase family protein [Thermoplasmatota archaeon]